MRKRDKYIVFFFQAEDGIRDVAVTGVQTCALPIFHDLARLLDFLERNSRTCRLELEQAADRKEPPALVVNALGKGPILVRQVGADSMLQIGNGIRRPGMLLAANTPGVDAPDVDVVRALVIGREMAAAC